MVTTLACLWPVLAGAAAGSAPRLVLQPHQQAVVDDLRANPAQKGLILYHHFGSGKTITSLAVAEALAVGEVIVLVPKHLQVHWLQELRKYGVRDPGRYRILDYGDVQALKALPSLQGKMVLIDESHRFIDRVRHAEDEAAAVYAQVYEKIQKQAAKVLSLSGSIVYNDAIDLSYQINLVRGEAVLPTSLKEFQKSFMRPHPLKSFFRGHVLEGMLLPVYAIQSLVMIKPFYFPSSEAEMGQGLGIALLSPMVVISALKMNYPVAQIPLTEFSLQRLRAFAPYLSYYQGYRADAERQAYPRVVEHQRVCDLHPLAIQFWYKLVDGALEPRSVFTLLKDRPGVQPSWSTLNLRLDHFQKALFHEVGAGRQIGNLGFRDVDTGEQVEPEKFIRLAAEIHKAQGPVVIYSHYAQNGIQRIWHFLKRTLPHKQVALLSSTTTIAQQEQLLRDYNAGKVDILLLNPEMSEGISLRGTDQLHILEPSENYALSEQIKGRVVRFRSHTHLPAARQQVHIFHWSTRWSFWNQMLEKRAHWGVYHREFNYYSPAAAGYDGRLNMKEISPDAAAMAKRNFNSVVDAKLRKLLDEMKG